jgi:CheY-like chemotaxis protein
MARANILIVEDSRAAATRLQRSLEQGQFSVELARNGAEALKKAQRKQFDAVITDEQMPVMSGQELCRELRNDERYAQTPIIFLTANQSALDLEEMREALGVSVVFGKPFRPEVIVRVVENELLNHRKNVKASPKAPSPVPAPPRPQTSETDGLCNVVQSLKDA